MLDQKSQIGTCAFSVQRSVCVILVSFMEKDFLCLILEAHTTTECGGRILHIWTCLQFEDPSVPETRSDLFQRAIGRQQCFPVLAEKKVGKLPKELCTHHKYISSFIILIISPHGCFLGGR